MEKKSKRGLSSQQSTEDYSGTESRFLTFFTDDQLYGVPIEDIVQIIGIQKITKMPEYPHYVKGLISLRENIIPVIDMRLRLKKPVCEYDERTCIIITFIKDLSIGFIVDVVDSVTTIAKKSISPPPISIDDSSLYIDGIAIQEDKTILLMNTKKLSQLSIY